jgi:uncharacterized membrane protein YhaH (DUF805 family)
MEAFIKELLDNGLAVLKKFNEFKGRSSRKEFWRFVLAAVIGGIALAILSAIPFLGRLFGIVLNLYELAIIALSVAVGIRRLHDVNKSGRLMLPYIIGFVPLIIITAIMGFTVRSNPLSLYLYSGGFMLLYGLLGLFGIVAAVGGIILIVFWSREGDPGKNKYGPAPKKNA